MLSAVDRRSDKTAISVNLAKRAARDGRRVLVIDGDIDNSSLMDAAPRGARACLVNLRGGERPCYAIAKSVFIAPILRDEERVAARLRRQPDVEYFDDIFEAFDFILIDAPMIDDSETRGLAGAVDRIVVVASGADRLPPMDEIADMLEISEHKIVGAVIAPARTRVAA